MRKRKILVFVFAVLFLVSLITLPSASVKADSNEPITFSSGLTSIHQLTQHTILMF